MKRTFHSACHSECCDQRLHERHWFSAHWCRHAGQTSSVSNLFHLHPQVQNHLSSLRGRVGHVYPLRSVICSKGA
jgi:hypothetical protein